MEMWCVENTEQEVSLSQLPSLVDNKKFTEHRGSSIIIRFMRHFVRDWHYFYSTHIDVRPHRLYQITASMFTSLSLRKVWTPYGQSTDVSPLNSARLFLFYLVPFYSKTKPLPHIKNKNKKPCRRTGQWFQPHIAELASSDVETLILFFF